MTRGTSNNVVRTWDRHEVLGWLQRAESELHAIGHVLPATRTAARCYRALHEGLVRPPKVAILGERNAGKSTLSNALIGRAPLPTSMLSSTRLPTHVSFRAKVAVELVDDGGRLYDITDPLRPPIELASHIHVGVPLTALHALEVIDWPGTDEASLEILDERLERLEPDFVIWCTPCTQAWTETERACWAHLPARFKKRALLAATFADLVSVEERDELRRRLAPIAAEQFAAFGFSALGLSMFHRSETESHEAASPGEPAIQTLDVRPLIRDHAAALDRNRAERTLSIARWVAGRSRRGL